MLINAFFQNSPVILQFIHHIYDSQLDNNLGDKSAKFATTAQNTSQKPLCLQGIKRMWKFSVALQHWPEGMSDSPVSRLQMLSHWLQAVLIVERWLV